MSEQSREPASEAASTTDGATGGRNRLGDETSPYLLQHQHNPVHWYAWGEEAFEAARRLDRPIFMSVGYSTCYWCHVMERESFEDDAVAAILNQYFIAIKVDREERPDVDDIYMTAVNVLNRGGGGWPMSVWLEPAGLKPFIAGTYFPKEDGGGRPGFKTVLLQIVDFWQNRRDDILQQADQVAARVTQTLSQLQTPVPVGSDDVRRGVAQLMSRYDQKHGGFGRQRKFPMASNFEFLIGAAWDDLTVRERLVYTLDRMATGGLYDQIGGGFHRYTVDEKWLVPHFEKMLYDNGQLASVYAEAYERTGDVYYAEILRETLDYIGRQMTSDKGAFFSAQDAEVNHREGENYIWTTDQVREALTDAGLGDDVGFTLAVYGFDAGTNFRDPHHPGDGAKNVVYLVGKPVAQAAAMGLSLEEFNTKIDRVNAALLAVRDRRDQPITDDKVIVGWNGLMIAGMADGGRVLGEPKYVDAARRAASFILDEMDSPGAPPAGGLRRTYRDGRAKISAFLEDYAYFIRGLLAIHRASGDDAILQAAVELAGEAKAYFWDESRGAYFDTLAGQSDLFVRIKSTYDGAVPSGNGVMLNNLIDLHEVTGDPAYLDDALAALGALAGVVNRSPSGSVSSLLALDRIAKRYPDRLAPTEGPPAPVADVARGPVRIGVSTSELVLASGASATFEITIEMESGHHVNAHEPGIDYLIPLTVTVAGGSGVEVEATYPAGEQFAGPEGAMLVHHGKVTIPVRVTRTGDIAGRPAIMLAYQVCTDKVCLAPQNEPLAVRIVAE